MKYHREALVAQLREQGITYLAPSDATAEGASISAEELINGLMKQPDSRLQLALIPLFIRHPQLANCVPELSQQLDAELSLELQTLYMAAVYLQRHWKSRFRLYLSDMPLLPDLFSQQLGLPSAEEYFGKTGLHDLAEAWRARSPYPFDRLAALNNTIDLFFEQLKLERSSQYHAPPR